ncbi:putative integral membrane protein [Saccharata proteae CBS 121410]|uniref:Integral membrane protein n=1 Tax=Saccharata proteae CBS 121410 TaxID=1314787 RepID=A0A9P4HPK1_9PEZI|nr:putative integral membrane protein [Saccharata proteae CBS 121410]
MKTFWGTVLVLLSIVSITYATLTPLQVLSELPQCGSTCVLQAFEASNCSVTDLHCICTNQELNAQATTCTESSCSHKDTLTTRNVTLSSCGYEPRDNSGAVIYTGVIGGSVAILAVILRCVARTPKYAGSNGGFGADDFAMLAAMVRNGLSKIIPEIGLGKDIWNVPFNNITLMLHLYYFDELLYINALTLTKISILLFYLRIFPQATFRKWAWSLIGCCVVYSLLSSFLLIFQCIPVSLAWNRWDGEHHGHCTNLVPLTWITALLNVFLDVVIIALPFPQLAKLNTSMRKKFRVMVMFALGLFVTVISTLRLHWMLEAADSKNPTWDWVTIGYWSVVEVDAGVLCACLPALRKLLLKTFPTLLGDDSVKGSAATGSSRPSDMDPSSELSLKPHRFSYGNSQNNFIPLTDIESRPSVPPRSKTPTLGEMETMCYHTKQ